MIQPKRSLPALGLILGSLLAYPSLSWAYEFVPTEIEWAGWPEYCRARYVTTNVGEVTHWRREYPAAMISLQEGALGSDTFIHVHHYCAGIAYLQRAKFTSDPSQLPFLLQSAQTEAGYTFERIPTTSPLYSTIAVTLSQIMKMRKQNEKADEYLDRALAAQPHDALAYVGKALLQRDMKKLEAARDTLLRGDEAVEGRSVEIHYNLGLILLELGELDRAYEYASKAYAAGYPLPGLKERLKKAGAWKEPQA
jgi:tetratricopeptide (TPR) repeat protein